MEALSLSVDELDLTLPREKSSERLGLRNESGIFRRKSMDLTLRPRENCQERPLTPSTQEKHQKSSDICSLPLLCPKDKSNKDGCSLIRNDLPSSSYNRTQLEDMINVDKQQNNIQLSNNTIRSRKSLLEPLNDKKSKEKIRKRSITEPGHSLSLRQNNEANELQAGVSNEEIQTHFRNEPLKMPDGTFNRCVNDSNQKLLDVPSIMGRRFSAPLSPRFVRRLVPEKVYSKSTEYEEHNSQHSETPMYTPDRSSIFSPTPPKDFDRILDFDQIPAKSKFNQSATSKTQRKISDLNVCANPTTRFLNEIKVSVADQNKNPLRKSRGKSLCKRKNSYVLSASSETLTTGEVLPPVKTSMPECPPPGSVRKSRALSVSGALTGRKSDLSFDSPMFLDVESQRLSHLSLSPRLPRKV